MATVKFNGTAWKNSYDSRVSTKSLYSMINTVTKEKIQVYIMQGIGYNFKNSIIKYESVGDNGGFVVRAGKFIKTIPVTIALIGDLKSNLLFIQKLENTKDPVILFDNINTGELFGQYLIESVDAPITDGTEMIIVSVSLVEYKEAQVNKIQLVIPPNKSLTSIINFMRNQNIIDKELFENLKK